VTNSQADDFAGRVVVGMDGSESALLAARWGAKEAALRGRGLTLAHAILPTAATGVFGVGVPPRLDLIDETRANAIVELTRLAGELDCIDIRVHVEVGTPSGLLLHASDTAELIVLGSRGRGGFANLLLGSVGAQVASHANCPVVVMRASSRQDASEVVVGIDGSPHSIAALEFAFNEASRRGWSLVAVHAWDVPAFDLIVTPDGPIPFPLENVADAEIRLAAEVLAGFKVDYPDVHVTENLVRSPAVQALLDASTNAALIVVGTRGRNVAVGALLGSVSNGILHKAQVPVAVIPLPEPEMDAA
jgi:nucleotide-binding universal stress UspA family protein